MSHSSTQTEAVEMSQVEVPMKERISLEPAGTTQTVPEETPRNTTKATEPSKSNKSHKKKKKKKEPPPLPPYHIQPVEQVLEEFKSSTLGLQESEIAGRVTKYGKNELKGEGGVSCTICGA
jgi:magnesium-transporting ATPase (P-type)